VGTVIDFESFTKGKLRRSNVLRKITGVGTVAVPEVIAEDCGTGSVAVVESRVAASSGEVAVSCRKVKDVVNGRIRRGGSTGGVTACGTSGLPPESSVGLSGSVDDVVSDFFCFFCGTL